MRCCVVVIEQRYTSESGVYIVLESLAAVIQAYVVESAQLMPRIGTPRRSCMHMIAIICRLHGESFCASNDGT